MQVPQAGNTPEEFERKCPNINARRALLAAIANEAEEEGRDPDRRFVPQRRR